MICLVNIKSNEKHQLNETDYVIGRGWLNCDDKRISKKHGTLKIISVRTINVQSTHRNPIFYKKTNNTTVDLIGEGMEVELSVGDLFGLAPNEFWFRIESETIEPRPENSQNSDVAISFDVGISTNNLPESETRNGIHDEQPSDLRTNQNNAGDTNVDENIPRPENGQNSNVAISSDVESSTNNLPEPQTGNDINGEQPSDLRTDQNNAGDTNVDENIPLNLIIKNEPADVYPSGTNHIEGNSHTVIKVKTEKRSQSDIDDEIDENAGTSTNTNTSNQSTTRECCRYGIRCYRRNPIHRHEQAHPGDADYTLPNYGDIPSSAPPCPYAQRCYRRNPIHFKQYSHPSPSEYGVPEKRRKITKCEEADTRSDSYSDSEVEEDPYATDEDSDFDPEDEIH